MNVWSRSLVAVFILYLAGCAEGAKLAQEREHGGIVVYPLKTKQAAVLSPFRSEALALMAKKCGGSYAIVREGETKGRMRLAGAVEGTQEIVRERRWAIQFECK
ncbi:hypothetical protein [Petrachloros mirabilis]